MKNIYRLFSILLVSLLVVFSNCGEKEEPITPQEQRAIDLADGAWSQSASSTVPDGVDPTILDNLTLSFGVDDNNSPSSFSSTGAPDFFTTSSSSTWSLSGTTSISLTDVEGGVSSMTIGSFSDTEMVLNFTFTTPAGRLAGGERISSLDGQYSVTMSR
jgi:hypothetical protein